MTSIYVPRAYQQAGEDLILREDGCLLAYEPGGGKTVTASTAMDKLMHETWQVERTIIVGPKMVAQEVWFREFAKWAHLCHLKARLITAADFNYRVTNTWSAVWGDESRTMTSPLSREDEDFLFCAEVSIKRHEMAPADELAVKRRILDDPYPIHVISRDHLWWLVKILGKDWPYQLMLGDESTSYKTWDSDRSKAVMILRVKGVLERLVLMSGTPSPKGLEQLWAQVRLMDGGKRLGSKITHFRDDYLVPATRNPKTKQVWSWKPRPGAVDEVMGKVADICLSVRADIWRENEPARTIERRVTIPLEDYKEIERTSVLALPGGTIDAANAAVLANKLLQAAGGAVLDGDKNVHILHEAKLDALEELVEELDGEPLVVLYWYQHTLRRLRARFPRIATTKTAEFIDKFAAGEIPLLALQPSGAGHGLDGLQHGGHHVAVLDFFHDWELYKQAIDRLDRSGQKYQVTVWQLIAEGTLEGHVAAVLADRKANQDRVMDAIRWQAEETRRGGLRG